MRCRKIAGLQWVNEAVHVSRLANGSLLPCETRFNVLTKASLGEAFALILGWAGLSLENIKIHYLLLLANNCKRLRGTREKIPSFFIKFPKVPENPQKRRYNHATMPNNRSEVLCEIACLGVIVVDIVGAPIESLPAQGTLELIDRLEMHIGGNAANTAAALAKLGIAVGLIGGVGADAFGSYVLSALASHGVGVSSVIQEAHVGTAASFVIVNGKAERAFLHVPGANATFTTDSMNWEAIAGARIFHVAGLQLMRKLEGEPIAQLLQEAQKRGMVTVLDTVMNPRSLGWEGLAPALPFLDWFIPSIDEAILLTGEREKEAIVAKLRSAGATNIVLKDGEKGCFLYPIASPAFHTPVFPVEAVDTLGAGDSWSAGFCLGLLRGWDLEHIARFANAVGATCVEAFGATTGILSESETGKRFGLE
jgi:sugar/nucleoside kinase (ribokinase family)